VGPCFILLLTIPPVGQSQVWEASAILKRIHMLQKKKKGMMRKKKEERKFDPTN
jgi:hypothetical protein